MPAGWYAALAVEQRGIDLEASLFAADGRRLTRVDSPNGRQGPEPVPLIGEGSGPLRLDIRSSDPHAPPGRYAVVVARLRRATAEDRLRVQADRVFAEGEDLRLRGDAVFLRKALDADGQSLALFRSLPGSAADHGREGDVLSRIGDIQRSRGAAQESLSALQEALQIFRDQRDRDKTITALNGIGLAYRALGEPRRAVACYQEALAIHRAAGGPVDEGAAVALTNLGSAWAALGKAGDAFQAYGEAIAAWQRLEEPGRMGKALRNLGRLYVTLGDTENGIDTLTRALPLLEGAGLKRDASWARVGLGLAEVNAGRAREGLAALENALGFLHKLGDRSGEAEALGNLCWSLLHVRDRGDAGDAKKAEAYCGRALALYRETGNRLAQGQVLTNVGSLQERRGDSRAAASSYAQSLPLLAAAGDRASEATALLGMARIQHGLGDLRSAVRTAEQALARVEALREEPASLETRTKFFAGRQDLYGLYVDFLMELHRSQPSAGQDGRALAASEQARARSLLDLLSETGADRAGASPDLLAREADAGRRLDAAAQRRLWLQENGASADRQSAADLEVRSLLAERERALAAIRRASPVRRQATVLLGPREIQTQVVDKDTLLLEYALGEDRSYLWAVAPDRLDAFELPGRAVLEEAARRVHTLLAAGNPSLTRTQTADALAELSQLVLSPVADRLGRKRLVVVADGALCYVPFAALPAPHLPGAASAGEPLVAAHEVVTLPSASSLVALRRALSGRPPAPATLAVLADPVFELSDPRIARGRWAGPEPEGGPHRGAVQRRFTRLPYSRREAETILALVPPALRLSALDFAASRETATSGALAGYRILHFATHGVLDTEHPALSGIALSMFDAEGRPRSGFLRAHEIFRLRLNADLVVLSACATALGRDVRGEGLVGLTQGFFHAGARAVLVSLWPVDDLATADLMEVFYRELLVHRKTPAAALREAQLALLRRPDRASPSSWAGFVLQGDWKP